jgi:hypothetical protein
LLCSENTDVTGKRDAGIEHGDENRMELFLLMFVNLLHVLRSGKSDYDIQGVDRIL